MVSLVLVIFVNTVVLWLLNQNENIRKLAKENVSKLERVNSLSHSLYFVKIAEKENCHSNSAKTVISDYYLVFSLLDF